MAKNEHAKIKKKHCDFCRLHGMFRMHMDVVLFMDCKVCLKYFPSTGLLNEGKKHS